MSRLSLDYLNQYSTMVKALSCHCKDPGSIPDGGLKPTQLQIAGYQLVWEVMAAGAQC